MRMTPNKVKAESVPSKPANSKPPDIATASVPDTLAVLHVNPDTGLTNAEVDIRLKEHGYNEVAEKNPTRFSCFSASSGGCRHGCSS